MAQKITITLSSPLTDAEFETVKEDISGCIRMANRFRRYDGKEAVEVVNVERSE